MKRFVLLLLLLVAVAAAYVATRPSEFLIQRQRTFAAPPELVFAYVNDFHKWAEWSPWEKLDPTMQREYSGPPTGPGASYHWAGNDEVGEGRMTIVESTPPAKVVIRLEFLKPFPATNTAEFYFDAGGLGTEVTWAMTGRNGFMAKAFGLVMDMDKLVGSDFEKGLAELDAVTTVAMKAAATAEPPAEAPPAPPADAAPPSEAPPADAAPPSEAPPAAP